jgi:cytochrome c biogenesis protein CcmG/thiol:disulfide interchange protein DsbE
VKRVLLIVGVVGLLGGLFAFGLLRGEPDRDIPSAIVGRQAPNFVLPLYERYQPDYGESFELADHLGKPLVINFWASWCAPCYEEAPVLQSYWERYQDTDVQFLGIQTQDRQQFDAGRQFMDQFGLSFPNGMDDASAVSVNWGLFGVPETYFINRDGTVEHRLVGPVTAAVLDEHLAAILR